MKLNINTEGSPFKISSRLITVLEKSLKDNLHDLEKTEQLVFVFKDEDYSAENGGFHPVEIRLVKEGSDWIFDYITDFCFVGNGYDADLVKEIDFDFTNGYGFHLYSGECELKKLSELYKIWEGNFISYVAMDVFTVKISLT